MGGEIAKIFGGFEKFSVGGMRNFRRRGLSREGLNFFREGLHGNFLGSGLRFFGCGWELLGKPS